MKDLFICYASEDELFVRELVNALQEEGVSVWFDQMTLTLGDSLRRSIDRGLAESKYGVVIISPNFLTKSWPQYELDGLVTREMKDGKTILPVWHNVTDKMVAQYSPSLAGKLAVSTKLGIPTVVSKILEVLRSGTTSLPYMQKGIRLKERLQQIAATTPSDFKALLAYYLEENDFRDIYEDLRAKSPRSYRGMDSYDELGRTKNERIRNFIESVKRRGHLDDLIEMVCERRPDALWEEYSSG